MARLLFLLTLGLVGYLSWRWYSGLNSAQKKRYGWQIVFCAVVFALVLLVLTGRLHWLMAVIGSALALAQRWLPALIKALPFLNHLRRQQQSTNKSANDQSSVNTDTLSMILDHNTGAISGLVVNGPLAGRELESLTVPELQVLYSYCQNSDSESCQLLEAYLAQKLGPQWQDQMGDTGSGNGPMDRAQALQILGLTDAAQRQDVIQAHRRLIQKLHPDRGGNDYLAGLLNQARDLLLENL